MYWLLLLGLLGLGVLLVRSGFVRNSRRRVVAGLLVVAGAFLFFALLGFWAEMLWFEAAGYASRFWRMVAAKLLAGEMPSDIERAFEGAGVSLFPSRSKDLTTDCSCPDWSNPCKHIAAVYYLLGERFDEDPFLLFELRGRSKDEVVAALRERRVQGMEAVDEAIYVPDAVEAVETVGLEECLERYWALGPEVEEVALKIGEPKVEMALLKRLGVPEFEGLDARGFWAQMERVYDKVTRRALEVAFADADRVGAGKAS